MKMSSFDLIDMAVRNLWKRKLRTFLTVLGVIIGTASIVVMISVGIGMNEGYKGDIDKFFLVIDGTMEGTLDKFAK